MNRDIAAALLADIECLLADTGHLLDAIRRDLAEDSREIRIMQIGREMLKAGA